MNEAETKLWAMRLHDDFTLAINPSGVVLNSFQRKVRREIVDLAATIFPSLPDMSGNMRVTKRLYRMYLAHVPPWVNDSVADQQKVGLGAAWYHIPVPKKRVITDVMVYFRINGLSSSMALVKGLKKVSDFCGSAKDNYSRDWMYLTNWHTVCGVFGPRTVNNPLLVDDFKHFLEPKYHGDDWDDLYHDTTIQVVRSITKSPQSYDLVTFDDFVIGRTNWVTSGSHSGSLSGKHLPQRNTKWSAAMALSDAELLELSHSPTDDQLICKAFVKSERVFRDLARTVINASFPLMMVLAYIMYLFSRVVNTEVIASYQVDKNQMWVNLLNANQLDSRDIGQYDHTQPLNSIVDGVKIICDEMAALAPGWLTELRSAYNLFVNFVHRTTVSLELPKDIFGNPAVSVKLPWLGGMLSGLPITSTLNSIFNLSLANIASYDARIDMPLLVYVLGDDHISSSSSFGSSVDVWKAYLLRDFLIKASGSSIGNYGEFCRYVPDIRGKCVLAYPVRACSSLVWRQDPQVAPATVVGNMSRAVTTYLTMASRGCDEVRCVASLRIEIGHLTKWSPELVDTWLHTPSTIGGASMLPHVIKYEFTNMSQALTVNQDYAISDDVIVALPPVRQTQFYNSVLTPKHFDAYYVEPFMPTLTTLSVLPKFQLIGPRVPLSAHLTVTASNEFSSTQWIKYYAEQSDWEQVLQYLDVQSIQWFNYLKPRCSKRVLLSWLCGRISANNISMLLHNRSQCSRIVNVLLQSAFGLALSMFKKISFSRLMFLMLSCELQIIKNLNQIPVWVW